MNAESLGVQESSAALRALGFHKGLMVLVLVLPELQPRFERLDAQTQIALERKLHGVLLHVHVQRIAFREGRVTYAAFE